MPKNLRNVLTASSDLRASDKSNGNLADHPFRPRLQMVQELPLGNTRGTKERFRTPPAVIVHRISRNTLSTSILVRARCTRRVTSMDFAGLCIWKSVFQMRVPHARRGPLGSSLAYRLRLSTGVSLRLAIIAKARTIRELLEETVQLGRNLIRDRAVFDRGGSSESPNPCGLRVNSTLGNSATGRRAFPIHALFGRRLTRTFS
jgi:hypothetical protein